MHTRYTNQHHQYHYKFLVKSSSKSFYSVDLETSNVVKAVPRNFPSKSTFHLKFVGSCNGLLCLTIARKKEPSNLFKLLKRVNLVLYPSTGDYKKLVEPSVRMYEMVGLGYGSSIGDCKIQNKDHKVIVNMICERTSIVTVIERTSIPATYEHHLCYQMAILRHSAMGLVIFFNPYRSWPNSLRQTRSIFLAPQLHLKHLSSADFTSFDEYEACMKGLESDHKLGRYKFHVEISHVDISVRR
ncbi:hypothetical protein LguiA_029580 [Lonicera macranthoides]